MRGGIEGLSSESKFYFKCIIFCNYISFLRIKHSGNKVKKKKHCRQRNKASFIKFFSKVKYQKIMKCYTRALLAGKVG